MIYSGLQSVASDFILFLLCMLVIDYSTVIRMNIHGLVHKQLLAFFVVFYFVFGSLAMFLVINSLCYIRVKEIMPHKESVYISPWPNFMPEVHTTYN